MTADSPPTITKFRISAPMMFPIDRDACFFLRAIREVTSSGREVPKATNVREMIISGTPKALASFGPTSTSMLAPI